MGEQGQPNRVHSRLRRLVGFSPIRSKSRSIRYAPEQLESRLFLSVVFTPSAYATPTNRPDLALVGLAGTPVEPFIRVNPKNPANIIPSSQRAMRISTNGGASFSSNIAFPNPPGTNTFNGDTGLAFDADGRMYWVNMAGTGTAGISVARMNSSSGTAVSTVNISNGPSDDKPFIAADATPGSPFVNYVYVIWTRFAATTDVWFSRSTNFGASFSSPIQLSNSATEGFVWPTSIGVAPNGDVYIAYHAGGSGGTFGRTLVRRSVDGGLNFATATQAFTAGNSDVTFNVQTSSGTIPGTQFWTQGTVQPWILPDPARPGNVYVVTNDDPNNVYTNGDDADVVIARSTNNGTSWTTSTIVSGPSNSFQLFPTSAIDRFGNIVVAWYDNRRGLTNSSGRYLLDIMATYSIDGGATWAPEFMVSDSGNPFDPDPGAANRFAGPPPTKRIGEYFGIDLYGGTAHLAWNGNTFSGSTPTGQQVWYGSFAIGGSITINGDNLGVTDDNILVRTLSGNISCFEVLVNGVREYAGLKEGTSGITVNGLDGNDTLTVDNPGIPVTINGGTGFDNLIVTESSASTVTLSPSVGNDSLVINDDGVGTAEVIVETTQTLGGLYMGPGSTLSGAGDLTIDGTFTWIGGTMRGTGQTIVTSAGLLNIEGISTANLRRTLQLNGSGHWTSGYLSFENGTFQINGTLLVEIEAQVVATGAGGTNAINIGSSGTLTAQGTGYVWFHDGVAVNNDGQINVNAGITLGLESGGSSTGDFTVTGAYLNLLNGHNLAASSALVQTGVGGVYIGGGMTHAGTTAVADIVLFGTGAASFAGTFSAGSISLVQGTASFEADTTIGPGVSTLINALSGAGDVTFTGTLNWQGGSMSGAGTTILASTAIVNISSGGGDLSLSRDLENNGTIEWLGGNDINMSSATLTNNGQINYSGSSQQNINSPGASNLINNSVINKGGSAAADINAHVNNLGTINVNEGTLNLKTLSAQYVIATHELTGGTWNIGAGATLTFPSTHTIFINDATISLNGPGASFPALVPLAVNNGSLTLATDFTTTGALLNNGTIVIGAAAVDVTGALDGTGSLTQQAGGITTADRFRQNALTSHGRLVVRANGGFDRTSEVQSLAFTGAGQLDLNDNALVVPYTAETPLEQIRGFLAGGYNNGLWNGNGIVSSIAASNPNRAIGIAEATDLFNDFPAAFAGESIDATTVLVRFTVAGDATLDQKVDISDLRKLATNFGLSSKRWSEGDFDFDGLVNDVDLGILARNWQTSLPLPAAPVASSIATTPSRRPSRMARQVL